MADEKEKQKELAEYIKECMGKERPASYLIVVLHKAQDLFGYISKETMEFISEAMDIHTSAIWAAVTFYRHFKFSPQGKYTISVCLGTACYVKGAADILATIKEELQIKEGETTQDMMFTLQEARCLGACGLAPLIMVNGKIHGELTPKKVIEVLKEYKNKGK